MEESLLSNGSMTPTPHATKLMAFGQAAPSSSATPSFLYHKSFPDGQTSPRPPLQFQRLANSSQSLKILYTNVAAHNNETASTLTEALTEFKGSSWRVRRPKLNAPRVNLRCVTTFPPGSSAFTICAYPLSNVTGNKFLTTHQALTFFLNRRTIWLWFFIVVASRRHRLPPDANGIVLFF